MDNGADLEAKDNEGKTPKDIAPEIFAEGNDTSTKDPQVVVETVPEEEEMTQDQPAEGVVDIAELDQPMEVVDSTVDIKTEEITEYEPTPEKAKTKSAAEPSGQTEDEQPVSDKPMETELEAPKTQDMEVETESVKEPICVTEPDTSTAEPQEKKSEENGLLKEPESMDLIESTPELEVPSPSKRSVKSPKKSLAKHQQQENNSPSSVRKEARTSLKFSAFPKPAAAASGDGGGNFTTLKAGGRRSSLPSSRGALLLQMSKKSSAKSENDFVNSRWVYY